MTRPAPILEILRHAPHAASEAIAIVDGARRVTYAELWGLVDRAAAAIEAEATSSQPVAIIAENSLAYLLAMFGALSSGRAVAEIGHHEPQERVAALLARVAPSLVLSSRDPAPFESAGLRARAIAAFAPEALAQAALAPRAARLDDLAFVVFTSGTTGLPKGVMLSHGNIGAVTDSILDYLPLGPHDRYALVLPLFHTYAKSIVMTTLAAGGTLVLDSFHDLLGFTTRLAEQRITAFSGVPYHMHMLLKRAPLALHDLSALRLLTISGSHFPPEAIEALQQRFPAAQVHFMYGLTETSTRACAMPPELALVKQGSCGRPIRHVRVRIVAAEGEPGRPPRELPCGEVGEVTIQGPNVMLGYWNDAAQTAAALREGWLHTGDLGHVDEDGFLYLTGRKSDLIKCAGERISAREIEEVLVLHPEVLEAAVLGIPHPVLGEAVQACIVRRRPELTEDQLLAHCALHLTHHKIPRAWAFLDELPKTPSGKVQKHRLLAWLAS